MTPLTYTRGFSTFTPHGEGGNRTHATDGTGRPVCGARITRFNLKQCDPITISAETFEHLNGVARITPAELPRYVDCRVCLRVLRAAIRQAGG